MGRWDGGAVGRRCRSGNPLPEKASEMSLNHISVAVSQIESLTNAARQLQYTLYTVITVPR